jgi:hypothetical protein
MSITTKYDFTKRSLIARHYLTTFEDLLDLYLSDLPSALKNLYLPLLKDSKNLSFENTTDTIFFLINFIRVVSITEIDFDYLSAFNDYSNQLIKANSRTEDNAYNFLIFCQDHKSKYTLSAIDLEEFRV